MFKYLFEVLYSWFYFVKRKFTRAKKPVQRDAGRESLNRVLLEGEKSKRRGEVLAALSQNPEMLVEALNLMYDFRDMVNKLDELDRVRHIQEDHSHHYISGIRCAGMIVEPRCPDVDPRFSRRGGIEHHCLTWEVPDRYAHLRTSANQQEQDTYNKIKEIENSVLN
jgi:hypothetical protein